MFSDKTAPMRVTAYPELGEPLLRVKTPLEPDPVVVPPLPPPQFDDRLFARLDAIVEELEGLRADLASRTLTARLRRFWAWLRRFW